MLDSPDLPAILSAIRERPDAEGRVKPNDARSVDTEGVRLSRGDGPLVGCRARFSGHRAPSSGAWAAGHTPGGHTTTPSWASRVARLPSARRVRWFVAAARSRLPTGPAAASPDRPSNASEGAG